jgi:hypothetical protein
MVQLVPLETTGVNEEEIIIGGYLIPAETQPADKIQNGQVQKPPTEKRARKARAPFARSGQDGGRYKFKANVGERGLGSG